MFRLVLLIVFFFIWEKIYVKEIRMYDISGRSVCREENYKHWEIHKESCERRKKKRVIEWYLLSGVIAFRGTITKIRARADEICYVRLFKSWEWEGKACEGMQQGCIYVAWLVIIFDKTSGVGEFLWDERAWLVNGIVSQNEVNS